jgi:signal transduction histidine kinase
VDEDTELLAIHRDRFPEMIRECPVLVESLVHVMLDRARGFAAANWEDEKVTALGRLAGGLAHELNNPAAAAARGAERLAHALADVGNAALAVGAAGLDPDQRAAVETIVARCHSPSRTVSIDPIERADLEEGLGNWLVGHRLDPDHAVAFVEGGVDVGVLESLVEHVPAEALDAVVRWIAVTASASVVARDVERAARRLSEIVGTVQRYTHMDRAPVREPTDLTRGLVDTVDIVRTEANGKGATIRLTLSDRLPLVSGVAPDLNQVWSNLLHNALDAISSGGEVEVSATEESGMVVVRVVDNGHGIPPDIEPRIFDPFFTTKPVGTGVGLGLDMVRRIVRTHDGEVEFDSRPGRTEFRVRLPSAG